MSLSILEQIEDLAGFRSAVREWLTRVVPENWLDQLAKANDSEYETFQRWWMSERNKVGMGTPHWPVQYGGAGLSLSHQIIVAEELARANAPPSRMYTVSLNHVPATLFRWGSTEQKRRYLPGVANGDVWCQGFSEPNAGSDLASLKTRAIRDGDVYVVNGQKIWSSYSRYADFCILLTRTDTTVRKQKGITYFIMDMRSPGVEVRPIRQANNHAEFGEIFLSNVRIPIENRIDEENNGWTVAQTTLSAERGVLAFERAERLRYTFERILREAIANSAVWLRNDSLRREFMVLFGELQGARHLLRQLLEEADRDDKNVSITSALVKLITTEHRQRFGDLFARIQGIDGQQFFPCADDSSEYSMYEYLSSFGGTIAGGTNDIMRNIIAERGLGLPR
jgi:alkylation response protein AidB-like acyl-CoA dehydrogenase